MEKVKLGKTDLEVSRISLGSLAFGHKIKGIQNKEQIHKCLNFAFDNGINLIDTAEEYGGGLAEQHIGEVIKERGNRDEVVVVTKVSHSNLDYKKVLKSAKRSLKHLQLDIIDIYLVHWPWTYSPLSETMKAMDELIEEGIIRYVGLSNYPNTRLQEAEDLLQNGEIVVNELEYNMVNRSIEKEILPFLRKKNIPVLAYSPLHSGFLTTKFDENYVFSEKDHRKDWPIYYHNENFDISQELFTTLKELATKYDAAPSEVAINWLLKDRDIFPILGSKTVSHIESAIHAASWSLSQNEISKLNNISEEIELNEDWFYKVR